jgi:2-keto-4-pentenoate hydratase/2-oxohepta-3-ene-1,7-dioic acid hydratase in catechol pathway
VLSQMYALASYKAEGDETPRIGVFHGDRIYPLVGSPGGEGAMLSVISAWEAWQPLVEAAVGAGGIPLEQVRLLAPLQYPGKILAAGSNYPAHAREMRPDAPAALLKAPYFFLKPTRHCVIGPEEPVILPDWTDAIDWEVELAVVIGKTARRVAPEEAFDYVFGYTILNDVTSRTATRRPQDRFPVDWFSGKGLESFCPMGPWVVPRQFVSEPPALRLTLRVNGEVRQEGNSKEMLFDIPTLIAYASQRIPLDPGDVLSTGTPSGVGAGQNRFLQPGDVMEAEIEGIGRLRNPVVAFQG